MFLNRVTNVIAKIQLIGFQLKKLNHSSIFFLIFFAEMCLSFKSYFTFNQVTFPGTSYVPKKIVILIKMMRSSLSIFP